MAIDPSQILTLLLPRLLEAVGTSALHVELLPVNEGGAEQLAQITSWPESYPELDGDREYGIIGGGAAEKAGVFKFLGATQDEADTIAAKYPTGFIYAERVRYYNVLLQWSNLKQANLVPITYNHRTGDTDFEVTNLHQYPDLYRDLDLGIPGLENLLPEPERLGFWSPYNNKIAGIADQNALGPIDSLWSNDSYASENRANRMCVLFEHLINNSHIMFFLDRNYPVDGSIRQYYFPGGDLTNPTANPGSRTRPGAEELESDAAHPASDGLVSHQLVCTLHEGSLERLVHITKALKTPYISLTWLYTVVDITMIHYTGTILPFYAYSRL
jgi:hypothetical protein